MRHSLAIMLIQPGGVVKLFCGERVSDILSEVPVAPKSQPTVEASREDFADGSAIVTYEDGSQLILESNLAKSAELRRPPVNYKKAPVLYYPSQFEEDRGDAA
jgi:hypothetical protein